VHAKRKRKGKKGKEKKKRRIVQCGKSAMLLLNECSGAYIWLLAVII
jgi:hypothetical protein